MVILGSVQEPQCPGQHPPLHSEELITSFVKESSAEERLLLTSREPLLSGTPCFVLYQRRSRDLAHGPTGWLSAEGRIGMNHRFLVLKRGYLCEFAVQYVLSSKPALLPY